jgi:hypothetical protein
MLLVVTGFAGAFVFIEPSPYEFIASFTVLVFVLSGASVNRGVAPLVLALLIINVGYAIAMVPVSNETRIVTWVLVSNFLAVTAMFYAAMLATNTQRRLELLMRGYLAAALVSSLLGIAAYFHLFGRLSDLFLLYGRSRGTFNDPNVLGAFLVLPAVLLMRRMLAGCLIVRSALMLLIVLAALLLTFSRGAWAQLIGAAAVLIVTSFIASQSTGERLRIAVVVSLGVVAAVMLVAALLSIGQVSELFSERAALEQSYDVGRYGRFGRYIPGFTVALDHPLGIGPLQFYRFFTEDPHNTFLNTFLSGGWLAGIGYLALCAVTLLKAMQFLSVRTPWQAEYQAIYAAYVGVVGESAVVDIDHWRHYFLIIGVLWGMMAASRPYRRAGSAGGQVRHGGG